MNTARTPRIELSMSEPTKVVVFHHQPVVAAGLATLVAVDADVDIAGVTSRPGILAHLVAAAHPNVVVLGFTAADESHVNRIVSRTWAACVGRKSAFVLVMPSGCQIDRTLQAAGLVMVTTDVTGQSLRDLVRGIGDVRSTSVPVELVRPSAPKPRAMASSHAILTARECEVLSGIRSGKSTKEIARALGISVNTTRTHAQRLMAKLRVHSRLQAAAIATDMPQATASGYWT